ncbi:MAG: hypothetical protein V7603_4741 [Micromonosporaceae bacterium]
MKRALALAAAVAAVVLILSGCGRHPLRRAGQVGTGGAAPAATPATAPAAPAGVEPDLSTLDRELSIVDSQLAQADQAADSDD